MVQAHYEHRMRRAKSWHEQSKKAESDEEKFIYLWIAFNAAYGGEPGSNPDENESKTTRKNEATRINKFLEKIIDHDIDRDEEEHIDDIINTYNEQIENFLHNRYAYKRFWEDVREKPESNNWEGEDDFEDKNHEVWEALKEKKILYVFKEVFWRLY